MCVCVHAWCACVYVCACVRARARVCFSVRVCACVSCVCTRSRAHKHALMGYCNRSYQYIYYYVPMYICVSGQSARPGTRHSRRRAAWARQHHGHYCVTEDLGPLCVCHLPATLLYLGATHRCTALQEPLLQGLGLQQDLGHLSPTSPSLEESHMCGFGFSKIWVACQQLPDLEQDLGHLSAAP